MRHPKSAIVSLIISAALMLPGAGAVAHPGNGNGAKPPTLPARGQGNNGSTGRPLTPGDTDRGNSAQNGDPTQGRSQVGTASVLSVSGTTVTLKLADGTTQVMTVNQSMANQLQNYVGQTIRYREVQNGSFYLIGNRNIKGTGTGDDRWTSKYNGQVLDKNRDRDDRATATYMRGRLVSINGTTATVRLSTSTVQSYTVDSQTAAQLNSLIGRNIRFSTSGGMLTLMSRKHHH